MTRINLTPNFKNTSNLIGILAILILSIMATSCTNEDDTPEEKTYIYLVKHNGEPEIKSLTILDRGDGTGSITTPQFLGSGFTTTYDMTIDYVNNEKSNISIDDPDATLSTPIIGAGFYTLDSISVDIFWTLQTWDFVEHFEGNR